MSVGQENVVVIGNDTLQSGPAVSGTLEPERKAAIRAQVPGAVLSVTVDQGSHVGRGALLAHIEDAALRESALSARSAVASAQVAAERAQKDLERQERLAAAGAIAERDLESARLANTSAQAQLADAKARDTMAQQQLAYATVHAPFTGVISIRSVSAGDVVQPGTALFTEVDPTSMQYEAMVAAEQLSMVRIGAPVTFTVTGYPGQEFRGKVTKMNPVADAATGQVRIVISVPNVAGRLVGGLFADGRVAAERRVALTAPFTAVDTRGLRPTVLRLQNGKAQLVEVTLGLRDEEHERHEIVSGVSAGDTLLTGAALGITPGTVVQVGAPLERPPAKG